MIQNHIINNDYSHWIFQTRPWTRGQCEQDVAQTQYVSKALLLGDEYVAVWEPEYNNTINCLFWKNILLWSKIWLHYHNRTFFTTLSIAPAEYPADFVTQANVCSTKCSNQDGIWRVSLKIYSSPSKTTLHLWLFLPVCQMPQWSLHPTSKQGASIIAAKSEMTVI